MDGFDRDAGAETAQHLFSLTDRLYRASTLEDAFEAALAFNQMVD